MFCLPSNSWICGRRGVIGISVAALCVTAIAYACDRTGAQTTNKPPSRQGGLRVEATGHFRVPKGELNPTGDNTAFWFHLSAAKARGKTSGGFSLELPGHMNGAATDFIPDPTQPPTPSAAAGAPTEALRFKVFAQSEYNKKHYKVEIDLTSNKWIPPASPSARGRSAPGTIVVRIVSDEPRGTGQASAAIELVITDVPYVRYYDRRNPPPSQTKRAAGNATRNPAVSNKQP